MTESDDKYIYVNNKSDLDDLTNQIAGGKLLANEFKFTERDYLIDLLGALGIKYEEFTKKYFYYDSNRNLHISESEFGYVWISTYGLIAKNKSTPNSKVNACVNQHIVISLLLDKAIEICKSESVYDVDAYNFGSLSELSPALFQNIIFYVEVFCKAYLSLSGINSPHTHKLSVIYLKLIDTMFAEKHNDSLFQILIVDKLSKIVDHVTRIPGNFKEQFIKYDDNPLDSTVVIFQPNNLNEIKSTFELCNDFITDYFYSGIKTHYLNSGLYQRLLAKAETEDQRTRVIDNYRHLEKP